MPAEVGTDSLQLRFGLIVRDRRLKRGLSQERLADLAGLHRTYVSLLERGRRMPSLYVIAKLAEALETTIVDLVHELPRGGAVGPPQEQNCPG
ncbi:MAG: helix-turn-helix transcriptional regulator [Planctomycetaceae bacterium]|nr:helix-turn-helix transcriptional regulator [Planctomycetaceae bacterium]